MKISKVLDALSCVLFLFCTFSNSPLGAVWAPPTTISSQISSTSQISTDASGNTVGIWQEFDGTNTNIQAATFPKGGVWSSPVTISSALGNNNLAPPQVVVNSSGYAVAVWEELNGTSVVRAATMQFGTSWSAPLDISKSGSDSSQIPQVAVDSAGNAVAVWSRNNGSFTIIQAASLPFGGKWSTSVDISPTNKDSFGPQVGVDASGNAVAVWTEVVNQIIQGATLPFGGSWTVPVNISSASDLSNVPILAVDPIGNAVATWTALSGGNFFIQASTLPSGGNWSLPVNISSAGFVSLESEVNVDKFGNAIALWIEPIGSDIFIVSASLPFGGCWSAPVTISSVGGLAFDPKVAFDAAGNAIAVWDRFNGVNTLIQAAMLPFGGSWSAPIDISDAGQDSDFSQIAIDSTGHAVVQWTNENLTVIQATTWTPSSTITNVNENFGSTSGGNTVIITGTNFINVTGVSFGSTAALSFTVVSPTIISAVAPSGTGTVDVTVTTIAGRSSTSIDDLYAFQTFVPAPQIIYVIPNNGPRNGGHSVRITGVNFTNVSSVKFGANDALSFVVVSPTLIRAITPPGSGTVDVTVTTATGTSEITINDHYTYRP